uniref:Uncharacterized protein n=1 Tax=Rhizophora mucronata TaxID=61149 RepID=A0A2P2J870_RHIMU
MPMFPLVCVVRYLFDIMLQRKAALQAQTEINVKTGSEL